MDFQNIEIHMDYIHVEQILKKVYTSGGWM